MLVGLQLSFAWSSVVQRVLVVAQKAILVSPWNPHDNWEVSEETVEARKECGMDCMIIADT